MVRIVTARGEPGGIMGRVCGGVGCSFFSLSSFHHGEAVFWDGFFLVAWSGEKMGRRAGVGVVIGSFVSYARLVGK